MVVWRVLGTQRHQRVKDLGRLLQAGRVLGSGAAGSGRAPCQGIVALGLVPLARNVGSSPQVFQAPGAPDDPESSVPRKKSILGLDFLSKLFHRNQVSPAAVQEVEQEAQAEEVEGDPALHAYSQEEAELLHTQEDGAYRLEEAENGVEVAGIQGEVLEPAENSLEESAVEMESVVEASAVGEESAVEVESVMEEGGELSHEESVVVEATVDAGAGEAATSTTTKKSLEELSASVHEFIKGLPPAEVLAPVVPSAPAPPAPTPPAPAPPASAPPEAATKTASPSPAKAKPAASQSTTEKPKGERPETAKSEKKEEKPATPAAAKPATEKPKAAAAGAAAATTKVVPSKVAKKAATSSKPGTPLADTAVFEFLRSKIRETGDKTPPDAAKPPSSPKLSPRFDPSSPSAEKTNAAINMLLESVEKGGKSPSPAAPIFEALNAKPEETVEPSPATPPPSLRLSLSTPAAEPAPMDANAVADELNNRLTEGKVPEAIALFEDWRTKINPVTLECNKPDRRLYNLYMQAKVKHEANFAELQEVVTEMEESGLPRDLNGYNILIRALFRKKDSAMAEKLLEQMEKEGPHAQPDADSYNLVVVLCAHDRKVLAATKYVKAMLEKGFEPSRTTINEVALATARSHQTKLGASLLKDLKAGKLPLPMLNTCAELLMAASEVDDNECARLALAAITERPMAKFGPKMILDEGTMIAVLGSAARTGDTALCNHAWEALVHHTQGIGKTPSVEAYLARVHALALSGDMSTAFRAVWELEVHHGRKQDSDTEAFSPFTSLKSLASACSRGGAAALDAAYYKLEEAHTKKQGVSIAAINCVIQGCANLWDSERAYQTFEAIESVFGLRPDIHSCNALLHALGRTKMTEDALRVYDYIKEAGFKPDKWTYMLLADAHIVNHDANAALDVLQTMIENHHRPFRQTTLKVWTRCKQQDDNDALDRLRKMEEALDYRQSFFANARRKMLLDVIKGDRPPPPVGMDSR
ncbi:pentatricopeptide repeat-containing protein At1g26460, mitochondrial-like [Selaginella moellendorffii]|uniref:pentatricopeptide repeat-containing protein At1g26460, mitochondrial-like n=1 Tax=Selaginella moellendorffii TaxID=88036 RepID=UPI000D1C46A0|nr:pentatricopeptide repeat-containing protein At1g26460, mitochondrial-like [Selaginella moellendorffii]|eukprot:XP_024521516.1 pentatricopeptide repeat-containing protein At1g26460, mitochondrial-like [Selaginella moellendorffii]